MLDPRYPSQTPARIPIAIALIQFAVFFIALSPLALVPLMQADATYYFETWIEPEPGDTATQYMLEHSYVELGLIGVGVVLLLVLAIVSAVGLHKGKRSARILTAIWVGILVVGAIGWESWVWIWSSSLGEDLESASAGKFSGAQYYMDALDLNIPVAAATLVLALLVFILVLTPAVRRWTPKRSYVVFAGQQAPTAGAQFGPPQQAQFPPSDQRQF
ncbi:hypothetical protein [Glycomyces buryatensis]|uniref:DUF2567 domain-containing protein n=1 Tax=Glycomyces buryatensis TaxID=2570927 RepID=A0A4S8QHB9_9ACTN|nr:hypothetical protein [Glycomyces buryatensis]THV40799.1 hypothetical protein FAB82_14210 [Glycomyces buryatensis]